MNIRVYRMSALLVFISSGLVLAQGFEDPGFETYPVGEGLFDRPELCPWELGNDAGIVRPYSAPISLYVYHTWSATFDAYEGEQYASTYGGRDTITQEVLFEADGEYRISAYAAAPEGTLTLYPDLTVDLETGGFEFVLDGEGIGQGFLMDPGTGWTRIEASFYATAGEHILGVRNTIRAPYFINYDSFSLVPEAGTSLLIIQMCSCVLVFRKRKHLPVGQVF